MNVKYLSVFAVFCFLFTANSTLRPVEAYAMDASVELQRIDRFFEITRSKIIPASSGTSSSGSSSSSGGDDSGKGEECDWTEYKNSLFQTESKGSGGYTAVNTSTCATGMYQFMPGTAKGLDSYKQADQRCKTMCKKGVGLATEECGPVQEAMMDEFTTENLKYIKTKKPDCWATIGQEVTGHQCTKSGVKTLTCKVTPSGILAGAHIGGAGGVCNTLTGGADIDDSPSHNCKKNGGYGTSRLYYVCKHGGKPVPGEECTPKEYPLVEGEVPIDLVGHGPAHIGPPVTRQPPGPIQKSNFAEGLRHVWVATLQMMTSQLTATMVDQVMGVGMLFDAKHQLEVQREFQRLTAQAHKDYHPSAQMCRVGTFVRHLAESEKHADMTQVTVANRLMDRETISGRVITLESDTSDYKSRLKHFAETHCNKEDAGDGMKNLCKDSKATAEWKNAGVDYTQRVSAPLTLDIDFVEGGEPNEEEAALLALLNNLFYNEPFPEIPPAKTQLKNMSQPLQNMRSIIAVRGLARNTIANIIAEKTSSPETATAMPFIRALLEEFGLEETEIDKMFGENPSYHAQMEVLTKKIYQHPNFVVNLYDKPANVKRMRAAMRAIKLMQDRDIHEAMMRREMLLSMILEIRIREYQAEVMDDIRRKLGGGGGPPRRRN